MSDGGQLDREFSKFLEGDASGYSLTRRNLPRCLRFDLLLMPDQEKSRSQSGRSQQADKKSTNGASYARFGRKGLHLLG